MSKIRYMIIPSSWLKTVKWLPVNYRVSSHFPLLIGRGPHHVLARTMWGSHDLWSGCLPSCLTPHSWHTLLELPVLLSCQWTPEIHMCFPQKYMYWSEGFPPNLCLSKSSTSSVKLSHSLAPPGGPSGFYLSCCCSQTQFPCCTYRSFAVYFLTLLPSVPDCELLGCRNGVLLFPVSLVSRTTSLSISDCFWDWTSAGQRAKSW